MAYKISSASSVSEKCETWQQKINFTRNKLHYETLVLVMLVAKTTLHQHTGRSCIVLPPETRRKKKRLSLTREKNIVASISCPLFRYYNVISFLYIPGLKIKHHTYSLVNRTRPFSTGGAFCVANDMQECFVVRR
jgi:hypothetical protein